MKFARCVSVVIAGVALASAAGCGVHSAHTGADGAATTASSLTQFVTVKACASYPGGWRASGVAANPASKAVTYAITVGFTGSSSIVIATAVTHVKITPGATQQTWTAIANFKAAPNTACVLRSVD